MRGGCSRMLQGKLVQGKMVALQGSALGVGGQLQRSGCRARMGQSQGAASFACSGGAALASTPPRACSVRLVQLALQVWGGNPLRGAQGPPPGPHGPPGDLCRSFFFFKKIENSPPHPCVCLSF